MLLSSMGGAIAPIGNVTPPLKADCPSKYVMTRHGLSASTSTWSMRKIQQTDCNYLHQAKHEKGIARFVISKIER